MSGAANTEQVTTSPIFPRCLEGLIVAFGNDIFVVGQEFKLTKCL
jgi:hypothetical protein